MSIKLGVLMDPVESINIKKDSTFAMLLAAQARGWEIHYLQQKDLSLRDGRALARLHRLRVDDNPAGWYEILGVKLRHWIV